MALDPQLLINWALEASMYFQPSSPGLTHEELHSIADRFGFKPGEIDDRLRGIRYDDDARLQPTTFPDDFNLEFDGDQRNPAAFDFIQLQLEEADREHGRGKGRIDVETLIARGSVGGQIPAHDLRVMVAFMSRGPREFIGIEKGVARLKRPQYASAATQIRQGRIRRDRERFDEIVAAVEDAIARRSDARPRHAEPLAAFGAILPDLGHARLGLWWAQLSRDFQRTDRHLNSLTKCVLAAAMTEAALMFVCLKLQVDDVKELKRKKVVDLARAAKSVIPEKLRERIERLNVFRQRIHVAQLLDDQGPMPELNPEQAREATETLEATLRAILDWHHTPSSPE